jgi:hypothetical protein
VATLTGPGGSISIGSSSGSAEEGITAEMIEEKDLMTVGADGTIMHSLRASNAARVSVRLLKTSPINAALSSLYNFQRQASGTWGQNVMLVSDTQRGDVLSLTQCAFARQPVITYAKDGNMNEWVFFGALNELLGAGVPDVNV